MQNAFTSEARPNIIHRPLRITPGHPHQCPGSDCWPALFRSLLHLATFKHVPWKNLDTHTQLVCQILIATDCQDLKNNLIIKLFKVHMNRNCEPFFYFLILKFRYCLIGFRRLNLPRVTKTFFFSKPKVCHFSPKYGTIPGQPKLSL